MSDELTVIDAQPEQQEDPTPEKPAYQLAYEQTNRRIIAVAAAAVLSEHDRMDKLRRQAQYDDQIDPYDVQSLRHMFVERVTEARTELEGALTGDSVYTMQWKLHYLMQAVASAEDCLRQVGFYQDPPKRR